MSKKGTECLRRLKEKLEKMSHAEFMEMIKSREPPPFKSGFSYYEEKALICNILEFPREPYGWNPRYDLRAWVDIYKKLGTPYLTDSEPKVLVDYYFEIVQERSDMYWYWHTTPPEHRWDYLVEAVLKYILANPPDKKCPECGCGMKEFP